MKKFNTINLLVGLFVASGLFIITIFIIALESGMFQKTYCISGLFDYAAGVEEGTPVYMGGVTIGKAIKIEFAPSVYQNKIMVTMQIHDEIDIPKNSSLSIKSQGFLGEKYLDFTMGNIKNGIYPKNCKTPLTGTVAPDLSVMQKNINDAIIEVKKTLAVLTSLINDKSLKENIIKTAENAESLTSKASKFMSKATILLNKIDPIIAQLNTFSNKLNKTMDSADDVINKTGNNLNDLTANLIKSQQTLQETLNSLNSIASKINEGKDNTLGLLLNESNVYDNILSLTESLNVTAKNVEEFSKILKDNPDALFWGKDSKNNTDKDKTSIDSRGRR